MFPDNHMSRADVAAYLAGAVTDPELRRAIEEARENDPLVQYWFDQLDPDHDDETVPDVFLHQAARLMETDFCLEQINANELEGSVESSRSHLVPLRPWLERLGHSAATAVAWTEYLVRALIERGRMSLQVGAVPSLGPVRGEIVDDQRQRAVKEALNALWSQPVPLVAAGGVTWEVTRTQDGTGELRVRAAEGTIDVPPRIQFRSGERIVAEIVGSLQDGAGVVRVTDDVLNDVLRQGVTDLCLIA
jgi:hypothetical protein